MGLLVRHFMVVLIALNVSSSSWGVTKVVELITGIFVLSSSRAFARLTLVKHYKRPMSGKPLT